MKILFKMKLQTDLNAEMDVNLILVSLFQFVEFSVIGGNIQGKFQVIRSWWIVWIQMLCKVRAIAKIILSHCGLSVTILFLTILKAFNAIMFKKPHFFSKNV